jgi:hypothetical protein
MNKLMKYKTKNLNFTQNNLEINLNMNTTGNFILINARKNIKIEKNILIIRIMNNIDFSKKKMKIYIRVV